MASSVLDRQDAPAKDTVAKLDTAGWGLFFIWVGVCLLADLSWGVFFFGTGILILGNQGIRHRLGLPLDRFGLALGVCFAVVGALRAFGWRLDGVTMPPWLVPALFIAAGAATLVSAWKRRPKSERAAPGTDAGS